MPAGICEVVRKNHGNKFVGWSREDSIKMAKFWKKSLNGQATVVSGHATVGRLSNSVYSTFQAIRKIFEKCHWRSRDSGRRSRDRRMTVKQRFLDVSSNSENFWKSHWTVTATVVGGHATVGLLSNNVFRRFKRIGIFFFKSLKVTRQWSEVTRPLDDCQTTFFWRFKQFENFLKKVAERSRDSGRRSRDRRMTVKQRFLDVSSDSEKFWKKSLKVTRQWSEVTRLLDDCQTTFFRRFKQFGKILKKSHWRSRDSGRRSRDCWMTVKQRSLDVSSNSEIFWKKSLKVTRQWSEVTRP